MRPDHTGSVGFSLRLSYRWKPLKERPQAEAYATSGTLRESRYTSITIGIIIGRRRVCS